MLYINIAIICFIIFESLNVIILYFFPDSQKGNGVAVFNSWQTSKNDEAMNLFVQYMTNWVAGTKLIFIVLLLVILLFGNETIKVGGAIVMILSIATFYFRLNPIMRKLDKMGQITPKGYSKKLVQMVSGFIAMFTLAVVVNYLA